MRILILGGDGYLGWPTAMHLSNRGHDVFVVDSYLKRKLMEETGSLPLVTPPRLKERARTWKEVSGKEIGYAIGDCSDYDFLKGVVKKFAPDGIVHYAEQPSGPYSMMGQKEASLTLNNNLNSTLNIIYAVMEEAPDAHIVKLGTMGEYGTPDIDIEEGWIDIEHKGRKDRFLFPRAAGSLYHTTKVQDTDLLWFYARTFGIRVTDLMQGPVYGLYTEEALMDMRLMPGFNYDDIFGTVLNRFLVQAVAGHPLTVFGKGGQTRGYLNIIDTMNCVELALLHPSKKGELRIFNQLTETFTVNELAEKVKKTGDSLGLKVKIKSIENPRKEKEEHYYNPKYTGLKKLGLKPNLLTDEVMEKLLKAVMKHRDKIDMKLVMPRVRWR